MKIRILVVDEAAFTRDALKRSVRRFLNDVEVYDALNGNRAVSVMRSNKIDIVISAWDLPEMSGSELLKWMRSNEKTAKTPFIVTSDEADRNLLTSAINAGASDFMAKPFSAEDVQKKVTKQLDRIGFSSNIKKSALPGQDSVGLLTGGASKAVQPTQQNNQNNEVKSAAGFGAPVAKKKKSSASKGKAAGGTALVKFSRTGFAAKCAILETSLTCVSCVLQRPESNDMPQLFDTAEADLVTADGEEFGQLKVFVFAMQSGDTRADATKMKLNLRFDGNEPAKFEKLSRILSQ